MSNIIVAQNPAELRRIVDVIHDIVFDREKIRFDACGAKFTIPFSRMLLADARAISNILFIKKYEIPICDFNLVINNADRFIIKEPQTNGPGSEDIFNVISYKEGESALIISTIFTKGIMIYIKKIDVQIMCMNQISGKKIKYSFRSLTRQ